MVLHFEELWEQCEQFHKENASTTDPTFILEELALKLSLYKALAAQKENLPSDFQEVKSRTLGEIMLTITNLSLQENIDVYGALTHALRFRTAAQYSKKYQAITL